MNPPVLIELQYLPPTATFALLARAGAVWLEAHEHYQKGSYRNRAHLVGPNGSLRLSVPLRQGKHLGQPIREVQLAHDEPWMRQHWQSIQTAYGNAPFFMHYADPLREVYATPHQSLWTFNRALFDALLGLLGLSVPVHPTDDYTPTAPPGIADWRGRITPRLPPPVELPPYPQVFTEKHGFTANLSTLDLLFCTGPRAIEYLLAATPNAHT